MAESGLKKYIIATANGGFQHGIVRAKQRVANFYKLLQDSEEILKNHGLSIGFRHDGETPYELHIETPLGDIKVSSAFVLDNDHVGAAVLFTDELVVDGRTRTRKLNSVHLGENGSWIDSDGENITGSYGGITHQCAYDAVMKALAAKLKEDSEYALSFKRAS